MATLQTSNPAMTDCIDACQRCHQACLQMAMTHCLEQGGKHVETVHFRLMINCAEICQTSANFMLSDSSMHMAVCAACAEVCMACADSCEQLGDMDDCVNVCRECAQHCEAMRLADGHDQQQRGTQSQQPRQ